MRNIAGAPVTGDDLFGREGELQDLWQRVDDGQHVLMLAPRRVGKTSLMQEMRRNPRPGWTVFWSDMEGGAEPSHLVADMMTQLARDRTTRRALDSSSGLARTIRAILNRVEKVELLGTKVELKAAIGRDWEAAADELVQRLKILEPNNRCLFIFDELPILISNTINSPGGVAQAEQLLNWLRTLRQDPSLRGKVAFLFGGSIGLAGVLRRYNMSAPINDLNPFHLEPWTDDVARSFLSRLAPAMGFPLKAQTMDRMLSLLGDAVPYHVQLFLQELRDRAKHDPAAVNEGLVDRVFAERLAGPQGRPALDHYAERLERLLPSPALETAQVLLDRICKRSAGSTMRELRDVVANDRDAFSQVSRLLQEDGYLVLDSDRFRFRSNLVCEYWRRHQAPRRGR